MKSFSTIILAALALGLSGLVALQLVEGDLDAVFGSGPRQEKQLLYEINSKEVAEIHVIGQNLTKATIKKKGGAWIAEEPWDDLADARLIQSIIEFSASLEVQDIIDANDVEDLAEYGLRSTRIEVALYNTAGDALGHYQIGRNTAWRSTNSEGDLFPTVVIRPLERSQKDYLYVCTDFVNPKLRQEGIRALFNHSLKRFRDPRAFYNHPLFSTAITLKEGDSEIALQRPDLGKDTPWRITKPSELATNNAAVQKLIATMGALEGIEVLDPSAVTLPAPTPENIQRTLTASYPLPGGGSDSTTLFLYPPEKEDSPFIYARIGQDQNRLREAVLRILRGPQAMLSQLPNNVNELRSRTLTSLTVKQLESLTFKDQDERPLHLSLEWNTHERARRWHVDTPGHQGPANESQVKALFEILFQKEILRFADDFVTDLVRYGLDQPIRVIELTLKDDSKHLYHIGQHQGKFYSHQVGTRRVSEIPPDFINQLSLETHRWRDSRLWHINPFEVRGLVIKRAGRPALTLSYHFFSQEWRARQNGQDLTARLNTNKADRLLEKLSSLRVHRWLGPPDAQMTDRLDSPNLTLSILTEEIEDSGETSGLHRDTLSVSQLVPGRKNTFFIGRISSNSAAFLLDLQTVKRLAVELLD